jgi:hypothetical protein
MVARCERPGVPPARSRPKLPRVKTGNRDRKRKSALRQANSGAHGPLFLPARAAG